MKGEIQMRFPIEKKVFKCHLLPVIITWIIYAVHQLEYFIHLCCAFFKTILKKNRNAQKYNKQLKLQR